MTTVEPGASEVFTQGLRSSPCSTALLASSPAPIITEGFEVLVQLVIAAITTRPWSSSTSSPSSSVTITGLRLALGDRRQALALASAARTRAGWPRVAVVVLGRRVGGRERLLDRLVAAVAERLGGVRVELGQRLDEGRLGVRRARSGPGGASARRSRARRSPRSSSSVLGEGRVLGVGVVEHPLLARVGVDELDRLGRAAGELEVAQRLAVDREDRAGRAELRRHVPDRRPVGEPERVHARAEELDELARPRRARAASR